MDPLSAFLFAAVVATVWTADWAKDFRDAVSGNGLPRHQRRMQQRQHDHDLRKMRLQHQHAERKAGVGGPRFGEAVAERIRRGPKSRDQMHGPRAWWFDLCADRAEEMTRQRREREQRRANGEQEWQKAARGFRDWYRRTGERAGERWQERNTPRDPHRQWADATRTDRPSADQPDPGTPDTTPVDAEVVDEPRPSSPQRSAPARRPELEPGWPDWGGPVHTVPEPRPAAGNEPPEDPPGTVRAVAERIPKPLGASPAEPTNSSTNDGGTGMASEREHRWNVNRVKELHPGYTPDQAAAEVRIMESRSGGPSEHGDLPARAPTGGGGLPSLLGTIDRLEGRIADAGSGPGSAQTRGVRPGGSPAVASLNGETVDPESLGGFASGMQHVAASMQASIEASIANLTDLGVSGGPIDDLVAMADAAAVLAGRSQSTAAHAASHRDIQGVAQSDPTVGGENYLGIGAGRR